MANKLEELALEFQAFNRLYADQLNRMIGKTNEIIAYLNSVRGDGTDVSGLIEDINEIKQAIYLLQETDVVISGDVETKYITLSGDIETKYAELVEMIENAKCKFDTDFKTNITVGGIEAGTKITGGTELLTVIQDMLKKVFRATTASTPSASSSNSGTDTSDKEVGTSITPKIKPVFTDGEFNTHYEQDSAVTRTMNAGCQPNLYTVQRLLPGGSWTNVETGTTQFTHTETITLTIPSNSTASTTSYRSIISYDESANHPKDSDQVDADPPEYNYNVKFAASAVTSSNITYNTYFRWYVGEYNMDTESFPTESVIKALPSKPLAKLATLTDGTKGLYWNGNATKHMLIVAIPAEFNLTMATTSGFENWKPKMESNMQTVELSCATASVKHNYKVYYFWNTTASSSLKITIEAQ